MFVRKGIDQESFACSDSARCVVMENAAKDKLSTSETEPCTSSKHEEVCIWHHFAVNGFPLGYFCTQILSI